ncbi:MAG: hypothetical protein LBU81_01410 [Methanosarcinales archaeon]|nr:hypothetical protein [Methanosarcinales archaeon]
MGPALFHIGVEDSELLRAFITNFVRNTSLFTVIGSVESVSDSLILGTLQTSVSETAQLISEVTAIRKLPEKTQRNNFLSSFFVFCLLLSLQYFIS